MRYAITSKESCYQIEFDNALGQIEFHTKFQILTYISELDMPGILDNDDIFFIAQDILSREYIPFARINEFGKIKNVYIDPTKFDEQSLSFITVSDKTAVPFGCFYHGDHPTMLRSFYKDEARQMIELFYTSEEVRDYLLTLVDIAHIPETLGLN